MRRLEHRKVMRSRISFGSRDAASIPTARAARSQTLRTAGCSSSVTSCADAPRDRFAAEQTTTTAPGGGTSWDQNSFEGDPGLLNRIPPYDLRLGNQSTCLDTGTTIYVAGPWISYPASYLPTDDLEKDPRPAIGVDIGADEAVVVVRTSEDVDTLVAATDRW